jgi:predicted NBD/HSP70 family sugar kinase
MRTCPWAGTRRFCHSARNSFVYISVSLTASASVWWQMESWSAADHIAGEFGHILSIWMGRVHVGPPVAGI